ncbi:hypothetical protein Scep_002598 [Stephania cephalantha]|uniref:Uncharacterized protein n=1 Tax=Stephania cephalantha TaxID=152367 RepID=A0AAP0Q4G2_9MAGN
MMSRKLERKSGGTKGAPARSTSGAGGPQRRLQCCADGGAPQWRTADKARSGEEERRDGEKLQRMAEGSGTPARETQHLHDDGGVEEAASSGQQQATTRRQRRRDDCSATDSGKQEFGQLSGKVSSNEAAAAVNDVEQRRGGALPAQSIP